MKKLFFICLIFFCGTAKAGGPYFQQKDPTTQQEFELSYQDIGTRVSSTTVASMISSAVSAATSSVTGIEVERSSFTITVATATTATTFVNTTLTCSVTLTSANNAVQFSAFGMIDNNGANNTYWTVTRNGANLGGATNGFGRAAGQSAGFRYPWAVTLTDSPGVVGLATYIVQIKVDAGSGGLCLDGYCKGSCVQIKK